MPKKTATQQISRVSRPRLYEQLVEQLMEFIESAQLGPGDTLPAERDLAERLGVSRATLAQALVALEVLGVIDVQHGTGAVLVYRPNVPSVIKGLREHRSRLPEIVEARSTLEVKLAELAAARRTDADMKAIDTALDVMADEVASAAELVMHKLDGRPVVIVRGSRAPQPGEPGSGRDLIMAPERDLFR